MQKFTINNDTRVCDILLIWLEQQREWLKPTSFDRKVNTVRYQVMPYLGDIPAKQLTADDVEAMVTELRKAGYSPSTIKKAVEAISGCYSFYRARGKIKVNPTEGFRLGWSRQVNHAKIKCYTHDEALIIQHECQRQHPNGAYVYKHGDLIILMLNTGLRIGELLALTWSDVNMVQRILTVNKNLARIKDYADDEPISLDKDQMQSYTYKLVVQETTKTAAGERYCPLNDAAYEAMQRLALRGKTGLVAKTDTGGTVHPSNLARTLKRIVINCGFPPEKQLGPHALRHTFATSLLQNGADIKKVSELLGHSTVQITYDYYVHFIPNDYATTVHLLDEPDSH